MEKNERNKIIGLSLGILIVLIIVVSSTYAYWQVTKTQETPNDIVAACLSLDLDDVSESINLDSAWPISDDEVSSLTGYTFTVTNNCDEEINYIVGLNRVEESNYLQDSSIKVKLDDSSSHVYGKLSNVEYADSTNTYTTRVSKQVSVESISANGTNEHTLRIWVSEDAPVSEQSKIFQGQVFITGGQGIEVPECFTIANDGTIWDYDRSCGTDVKVPAEINGIKVKTINILSFLKALDGVVINKETGDEVAFLVLKGTDYDEIIINLYKEALCDNPENCNLSDYINIIDSVDKYNSIDWTKYEDFDFQSIEYNYEMEQVGMVSLGITSLDLSETIYLETIGYDAFLGEYETKIEVDDTCQSWGDEYYYCKGILKEVKLPKNGMLTTIDTSAFENNQLTTVTIPATVQTIGYAAFDGNDISKVTFEDTEENPSRLTEIHENAFSENQLTKVVIPGSITYIDSRVFSSNPNLTDIIIKMSEVDALKNVTLETHWNYTGDSEDIYATVTYNPNYTE